ncbi:MAG: hypothetical protein M3O30_04620 [Planctomycetota bacterium]|nr:hypothetical protein [Planctomycetota bacterium]
MKSSAIATAADYADAMLTARKAKNVLWSMTLLMIMAELALFFVARYQVDLSAPSAVTDKLKYVIGLIDFLGVVTPMVLAVVLLLILAIMLIGRLIGVARVVSAFIWCVLLTVLLFPWQAFLINQTFTSTEFKIPGVLYTWSELLLEARYHPAGRTAVLFWGRFVGWPVAALAIVLVIGMASRRGLRLALGEESSDPVPVVDADNINDPTRI